MSCSQTHRAAITHDVPVFPRKGFLPGGVKKYILIEMAIFPQVKTLSTSLPKPLSIFFKGFMGYKLKIDG